MRGFQYNKYHLAIITSLLSTGIFQSNAYAKELLGVRIGATYWDATAQGRFQTEDVVTDMDTLTATRVSPFELGIPQQSNTIYSFELRHNLPIIPRLSYTVADIEFNGSTQAARDINFAGATLTSGSNVNSSLDLSFQDITFYYSFLNSWIHLDLGVTQRSFDGRILLNTPTADDTGGGDGGGDGADGGGGGDAGGGMDAGAGGDAAGDVAATGEPIATFDESPTMLFTQFQLPIAGSPVSFSHRHLYSNSGEDLFSDRETALTYEHISKQLDYSITLGYKKINIMSPELGELQSRLSVAGPFLNIKLSL